MKKLLMVAVSVIALSGCMATNQERGAVIGGATGVGVLLGAITGSAIGESMDRPRTIIHRNVVPSHHMNHFHSKYERQCLYVPHRYVDFHGHYHDYSRIECRMIRRGPHFH